MLHFYVGARGPYIGLCASHIALVTEGLRALSNGYHESFSQMDLRYRRAQRALLCCIYVGALPLRIALCVGALPLHSYL